MFRFLSSGERWLWPILGLCGGEVKRTGSKKGSETVKRFLLLVVAVNFLSVGSLFAEDLERSDFLSATFATQSSVSSRPTKGSASRVFESTGTSSLARQPGLELTKIGLEFYSEDRVAKKKSGFIDSVSIRGGVSRLSQKGAAGVQLTITW